MATIVKKSYLSGLTRRVLIPQYDSTEFEKRIVAWKAGRITLEEAFPDLNPELLDFIRSGNTPDDYDKFVRRG